MLATALEYNTSVKPENARELHYAGEGTNKQLLEELFSIHVNHASTSKEDDGLVISKMAQIMDTSPYEKDTGVPHVFRPGSSAFRAWQIVPRFILEPFCFSSCAILVLYVLQKTCPNSFAGLLQCMRIRLTGASHLPEEYRNILGRSSCGKSRR